MVPPPFVSNSIAQRTEKSDSYFSIFEILFKENPLFWEAFPKQKTDL